MTTIACDGKSMAGDGLATRSTLVTAFDAQKVTMLDDGRIIGAAGEKPDTRKFRAWLQDGGPRPKLKDLAALVLHPDGRLVYHTDSDPEGTATGIPNAIGSGCEVAIGAMLAGLSPEKAVEIAAARDVYTGGTITVFRIANPLQEVA
jgi:ATP-dependent protease HslVU (ClpYQ) peptidase subunit